VRQELVQRRIEQPDRDRVSGHRFEHPLEVLALHREQLGERAAAARLVRRHDHFAHRRDAIAFEEHMLGAAQANSLGTELTGALRVRRGVGVGAHPQPAVLVRPHHQLV